MALWTTVCIKRLSGIQIWSNGQICFFCPLNGHNRCIFTKTTYISQLFNKICQCISIFERNAGHIDTLGGPHFWDPWPKPSRFKSQMKNRLIIFCIMLQDKIIIYFSLRLLVECRQFHQHFYAGFFRRYFGAKSWNVWHCKTQRFVIFWRQNFVRKTRA